MSDDWKPGDLALCVHSGKHINSGRIYTVEEVVPFSDTWETGELGCGLILVGVRHKVNLERGFYGMIWHGFFRKIHPHQPDSEDTETIVLLNRERIGA